MDELKKLPKSFIDPPRKKKEYTSKPYYWRDTPPPQFVPGPVDSIKLYVSKKGPTFRMRDNLNVADYVARSKVSGLPTKDICTYVRNTWKVEIPEKTINAMEYNPKWARIMARYRRNIGPILRSIPGVAAPQRLRCLSNILMNDEEDSRTRILAAHELENQIKNPGIQKALEQYDNDEMSYDEKMAILVPRILKMLNDTRIKDTLKTEIEDAIIKAADKIKSTRGVNNSNIEDANITPAIENPS